MTEQTTGPPDDEGRPLKEPAKAEKVVTSHPSHTTSSQHKTDFLDYSAGHITVRGPGRCTECSFHVATQGHRVSCSGTAPVAAELDPEWEKLDLFGRLERRAADDPKTYEMCHGPIKRAADRIRAQREGTLPPARPANTTIAAPGTNPAYVAASITKELNRLAAATEGHPNATLCSVACAVFEFVKGGHADETRARAELERIALAIGLGDGEIKATFTHTWNRVGPRDVPAPGLAAQVTEVTAAELLPPLQGAA